MENDVNPINEKFINLLKENISRHKSVIDEVADLLKINYDAAYRRVSGKVGFSLEEGVILSEHLKISLNELFGVGSINSFVVKHSAPIRTMQDFEIYFDKIHIQSSKLINKENCNIILSAREIPMFYFLGNPILIKYRIYILFFMMNVTSVSKRIDFKDFVIFDAMIEKAQRVFDTYKKVKITEIWNFGALNNSMQQLIYFTRIRQIDNSEAQLICDALEQELKELEELTLREGNSKRKLELYNNEVTQNDNSIILTIEGIKHFVFPYNIMKFLVITDQNACKEQESYILDQMKYCTKISNSNTIDHANFFNNKYDKFKTTMKYINKGHGSPFY